MAPKKDSTKEMKTPPLQEGEDRKRGPSGSPPDAPPSSRQPTAPERHNTTGSTQSNTSASGTTSGTPVFLIGLMHSPRTEAAPSPLQRQGTGVSMRNVASSDSSKYPNILNSPNGNNPEPTLLAAPQRQGAGEGLQSIRPATNVGPEKGSSKYPDIMNPTNESSPTPTLSAAPHRQVTSGITRSDPVASSAGLVQTSVDKSNITNSTTGSNAVRVLTEAPQHPDSVQLPQNNPAASGAVSGSQPLTAVDEGYASGARVREELPKRTILADELVWYCSDCFKNQKERPTPQFNLFLQSASVNRCWYYNNFPKGGGRRCTHIFDTNSGDIVQPARDHPPKWALRMPHKVKYVPWSKDEQGKSRTLWDSHKPFEDLPESQQWPEWYCCRCNKDGNRNFNEVLKVQQCTHTRTYATGFCRHGPCPKCSLEPWPFAKRVPKWWCHECRDHGHELFRSPLEIEKCPRYHGVNNKTMLCNHTKCGRCATTYDEQWLNARSYQY
jgi:hypothetical protein